MDPRIAEQKKNTPLEKQSEFEKLSKQLQVMWVEIDHQRAESIHLFQTVEGKRYEMLGKVLCALLDHGAKWDWEPKSKEFHSSVSIEQI